VIIQGPQPADGNLYVSDGDMLSMFGGQVCMRNRQLTKIFKAKFDMGLDALDILTFGKQDATVVVPPVIAFSTELDHYRGLFTAGDLLFTTGGIIPNHALTFLFKMRPNMGLDGVHFVGSEQSIKKFYRKMMVNTPSATAANVWREGGLQRVLTALEMDIWFSIEGSYPTLDAAGAPLLILDGDVLSARTGTIVARQSEVLPGLGVGPYPTDPRIRGVDFGLDGLVATRSGDPKSIHFSTEILYKNPDLGFFDGDVLQSGGALRFANETLVGPFFAAYDYLGLDAISFVVQEAPTVPLPPAATDMRGN
jgi:hypothetical protein